MFGYSKTKENCYALYHTYGITVLFSTIQTQL